MTNDSNQTLCCGAKSDHWNTGITAFLGLCGLVATIYFSNTQTKIAQAQKKLSEAQSTTASNQLKLERLSTIRNCAELLKSPEDHLRTFAYLALNEVGENDMVEKILEATGDSAGLLAIAKSNPETKDKSLSNRLDFSQAANSVMATGTPINQTKATEIPPDGNGINGNWVYLGHWQKKLALKQEVGTHDTSLSLRKTPQKKLRTLLFESSRIEVLFTCASIHLLRRENLVRPLAQ